MKTKIILLFVSANLLAILIITLVKESIVLQKQYGTRFRPASFIMSDSVILKAPVASVFRFYTNHYHEVYGQTAAKHHDFKLLNSDTIATGSRIFCREGNDKEMIYHMYQVREVIPNRLVYKSSEPSLVMFCTSKGIHKDSKCNAYVYVDFSEISQNESQVSFTVVIQMPTYFHQLMGRMLGGTQAKNEWETHLREELGGFRAAYFNGMAFYPR